LVWGKKQPKGWARWHDDRVSGNNSIKHDTSKHLTSSLNVLLVDMKRETDRYSELAELAATRGVRGQGPTAMLQHAFDVGKAKERDCNKIYNEKIELETGKRVVVRDGWDNATPHTEKRLRTAIQERNDQEGWLWKVQPPNSPLTNTCDAGSFPALAKVVTGMQGLNNRGLYLMTEKLWELLQKGWNEYPEEKIARLFVHQTAIGAKLWMILSRRCLFNALVHPWWYCKSETRARGHI